MTLFADGPAITISLEAAGTFGVTVAGGLVGGVKLLVGFFRGRERDLLAELRANREERLANLQVQRKQIRAARGLRRAIAGLSDRLGRIEEKTAEHNPCPDKE